MLPWCVGAVRVGGEGGDQSPGPVCMSQLDAYQSSVYKPPVCEPVCRWCACMGHVCECTQSTAQPRLWPGRVCIQAVYGLVHAGALS